MVTGHDTYKTGATDTGLVALDATKTTNWITGSGWKPWGLCPKTFRADTNAALALMNNYQSRGSSGTVRYNDNFFWDRLLLTDLLATATH